MDSFARLKLLASFLIVGVCAWIVHKGFESGNFRLAVVEVTFENADAEPHLSSEDIQKLASLEIGKSNLMDVDLKQIESRILTEKSIAKVSLQKKFPETLTISVTFRQPIFVVAASDGLLKFVDENAVAFNYSKYENFDSLPLLSGVNPQDSQFPVAFKRAVYFMTKWNQALEESQIHSMNISQLSWNKNTKSFRVYGLYREQPKNPLKGSLRFELILGQNFDSAPITHVRRLERVLTYASKHSIDIKKLVVTADEKIVVKPSTHS